MIKLIELTQGSTAPFFSLELALHASEIGITALKPIRERFPRFADLLDDEPEADLFDRLRAAGSVGRPLGGDRFLARISGSITARTLRPGKRGPKPKAAVDEVQSSY